MLYIRYYTIKPAFLYIAVRQQCACRDIAEGTVKCTVRSLLCRSLLVIDWQPDQCTLSFIHRHIVKHYKSPWRSPPSKLCIHSLFLLIVLVFACIDYRLTYPGLIVPFSTVTGVKVWWWSWALEASEHCVDSITQYVVCICYEHHTIPSSHKRSSEFIFVDTLWVWNDIQ